MKKWLIGCGIAVALLAIAAGLAVWYTVRNPMDLYERKTRRTLTGAGFTKHMANVSPGPQTFFEAGSGRPLVFLHGAGDQAGAWCKVAPRFTDRYRVLVVDLPGHGDSAPAEGPLPLTSVLDGFDAVMQERAPSDAVLVGNSMGAWIAMLYAERHPDAVTRIVAVNGGALRQAPAEGLTLTPADREEARKLMQALRDPSAPALPDFVLDDIVRRGKEGPIPRLFQAPDDLQANLMDDGRLAALATPVDLLWGASDGLMTLDYAHAMADRLPRARITEVAQCGHIPQNECPERFAAKLEEVLAMEPPAPDAGS